MATGYLQGLLGENYEDTRRSALNQGLLAAGLQGLAASGPSLTPTSAGQVLGQAGMAGVQAYGGAMDQAEQQGIRRMELNEVIREKEESDAFNVALNQVFQGGKIDYNGLQKLALINPERVGQVMTALNATKQPTAPSVNLQFDAKTGTVFNPRTGQVTTVDGFEPSSDVNLQFDAKTGTIFNPSTGEITQPEGFTPPVDQPTQKDTDKAISDARKEFTNLAPVKMFSDQSSSYGRIVASAADPSPAGDLALIFNYMKVLDPGSAVRETEFANAQNAGSVPTRIRSLYNNVLEGTRLTPEQRADFVNRGTRIYQDAERQYKGLAEQYSDFAVQAGLPPERIIPDFTYRPATSNIPPAPEGVNSVEWPGLWGSMTPQERKAFRGGK